VLFQDANAHDWGSRRADWLVWRVPGALVRLELSDAARCAQLTEAAQPWRPGCDDSGFESIIE